MLLLFVHEEYHGKTHGQKLLDEAVEQAVQKGIIQMHVNTICEHAAKFYSKYGFKDNGVMLELTLKIMNKPRLLNCPEGGFLSH